MRSRGGFSMVELIVSMVLLSVVALTIGSVTAKLASTAARGSASMLALDLVDDRLRAIQSDPSYVSLEARYAGAETALAGYPGMVRTTAFTHVTRVTPGNRLLDYKVAVVSVTGPGLTESLVRSIAVGSP